MPINGFCPACGHSVRLHEKGKVCTACREVKVLVQDEHQELINECNRFREHSVILNSVAWRLGIASGSIPEGATDAYEGDIEEELATVLELARIGARVQSARVRPDGLVVVKQDRIDFGYSNAASFVEWAREG